MNSASPMLACGSMHFSPVFSALILGTLILWAISALLVVPNLILMFGSNRSSRCAMTNLGILMACCLLTAMLFSGTFAQGKSAELLVIVVYAIPVMMISQFAYLFYRYRHDRRQNQIIQKESSGKE
jgi:uncharacterized paraquat-inducible protein A